MAKYYAVRNGYHTGIFNTWDECKKEVSGFSGAEYKSFTKLEDAKAFLGENEQISLFDEPKERKSTAVAYVDGSYNISTKEYACGVIIFYEGKETTFSRKFSNPENASMRNVAGEIEGAKLAMQFCIDNHIEEIGNLKKLYNLKVLDLSHNKITSMNGIENLYKLKVLYLMNNKIYKLCNLNDLLQLEYLILDKNKISDISKIPVKIKYIDLGRQEIDLKDYKNTENKYSLNTSFIKLRGGEDLDIDYILENGKYDNHTKTIIWENLSTDKLQFEFNNIEDDWMNFSGIVNICLVDKI